MFARARVTKRSALTTDSRRARGIRAEPGSSLGRKPNGVLGTHTHSPNKQRPSRPMDSTNERSPRELEVLGLVARGSTNREIAEALYLSPLTVKTHVSRILTKLRARDRVQLVVIAYQAGLVSP